jgi:site-specific DNA-methyltransferase (adenine-specific)
MRQFIPLSQVIIPAERQRETFDAGDLNSLRESIEELGLIHAIVLRAEPEGFVLVAGHRRLLAVKDSYDLGGSFKYANEPVPSGMIPFTSLGQLSEVERLRVELDENDKRVNLTWQEKAKATEKLARLLALEAVSAGGSVVTVTEIATAKLDGAVPNPTALSVVTEELIAARYLNDPEVQKAATLKDAVKLLKRRERAERAEELGAALGASVVADQHKLFFGKSEEWLEACPNEQFDVILTDPPYGMGADEFGDSGGAAAGAHFYEDGDAILREILRTFPALAWRVTKPQAHAYIFCDIERFFIWKQQMEEVGWKCFRTPLIWHKPSAFRAPWPDKGPQRKYETLLFAVKGGMNVTKLLGDVLTYQPDENLGHPAQKPVALYEDLLRRSCIPGMKVFDPFCGSGPIFPAAQACKVFATGIEKDAAAYGLAAKRVQDLKGVV